MIKEKLDKLRILWKEKPELRSIIERRAKLLKMTEEYKKSIEVDSSEKV